jgi:hypothetical protein
MHRDQAWNLKVFRIKYFESKYEENYRIWARTAVRTIRRRRPEETTRRKPEYVKPLINLQIFQTSVMHYYNINIQIKGRKYIQFTFDREIILFGGLMYIPITFAHVHPLLLHSKCLLKPVQKSRRKLAECWSEVSLNHKQWSVHFTWFSIPSLIGCSNYH